MNDIAARLAAASGAVYVVAVIAGSAMFGSGSTTVARAGLVLTFLSFIAFAVFVGFLYPVLRRAEGQAGWLATVALVAGVLHAASRFELLGAEVGAEAAGARVADSLQPLNEHAFLVSGLLLGLYATCVSGVCLAHRLFPRWLGWLGAVAGAGTVVAGIGGLLDDGWWVPWPFLATGVWMVLLSGLLTARPSRVAPSTDGAAAVRADLPSAVS